MVDAPIRLDFAVSFHIFGVFKDAETYSNDDTPKTLSMRNSFLSLREVVRCFVDPWFQQPMQTGLGRQHWSSGRFSEPTWELDVIHTRRTNSKNWGSFPLGPGMSLLDNKPLGPKMAFVREGVWSPWKKWIVWLGKLQQKFSHQDLPQWMVWGNVLLTGCALWPSKGLLKGSKPASDPMAKKKQGIKKVGTHEWIQFGWIPLNS